MENEIIHIAKPFPVVRNSYSITLMLMWPFKKKTSVVNSPAKFDSILCIPGHWKDDQEIKLALIEATNGEYMAAGGVMMNAKNKQHFTFEVCERDERMKDSFAAIRFLK